MNERRILVFTVLGKDAELAVRVLGAAGIEAVRCAGEAELLACLHEGAGALLVVEEALSSRGLAQGLEHFLSGQAAWSDLPVLVLTHQGAESLEVQRASERLGNVTLLERPVRTISLVSAAKSALSARERQYQVRALNRRKDEFLATLAHELRNPLAPIRNAVSIIERLHPTPQVGSLVGMVDRQLRHLTRLVDDLLDVARITTGKLDLRLELTTVRSVLTHALEIAQADIDTKSHRLQLAQPEAEVVLRADHVRVVQCLANLLVNAAKFTPPSGEIALRASVSGQHVEFAVSDSGKGLQANELEPIFDMFEQAQVAGESSSGLGLGLHLTKSFVQLHGGTATASSDGPGTGSTFVLRMPIVVPREPAQAGASAHDGPGLRLPRTVLVVDDNVDAARTLEALLSLHDIGVSVVHDGAQAVALVARELPDAVIMDIGMPVMNGYEAARRIREMHPQSPPVLVALTGWGQYADKAMAVQAGFDFHFVKPIEADELVGCLSDAMERIGQASVDA